MSYTWLQLINDITHDKLIYQASNNTTRRVQTKRYYRSAIKSSGDESGYDV